MRFPFIIFIVAFLMPSFLWAENSKPNDADSGIKGKVIDKASNLTLEYATVMVYNQADSSFVTGSISGKTGEFDIKLKPGKYYITVQFIAYKSITLNNITVEKGSKAKDLGELKISPDSALLDEIEVVADRTTVEMSLDKRIINIGRDMTSKASNAIEVLENVPSVTVDVEGNVSLRGDDGVRILIDGKVSGLAGISSRDALRSIQSDMIERIEIVTNPSVRYDAEGTSGIINIVLKKDRRKGFNGSLDLTTGFPLQAGIGINTNYRLNKVNFFANYSLNYRENVGGGTTYREFYRKPTFVTEQNSERVRRNLSNTFRTGAEYNINPNNSLTLSVMYRLANQNNTSTMTYDDYQPIGSLFNKSERVDEQEEEEPNLQYGIDYRKQFKKKDQLLSASIQYFNNTEDAKSNITERVLFAPESPYLPDIMQQTMNDEKESNLQIQADYFHPFMKKAKLEAGVKLQLRDIANNYKVEDMDAYGNLTINPDFTNHFDYNEKIFAAYAQFGNDVGRYSYQLGLRTEVSDIHTKLYETNDDNRDQYPDLFPSAHFTYKLTESDNIQVSYSRRIRRPGFRQLNPFRTFSDNRNIWSGNPNLKPVYTNAFETGYLRFWKNASFNANAYYRHSTDVFQRIERVNDEGISISRPENFASNESFGLEFIGMATLSKWFNLNGNVNLFRSMTEGEAYGINYATDNYSWTSRLAGKFTIAKGFDSQLSFNYQGKMDTPQGSRLPSWSLDLGFGKDVLKNKGTITLNVRDLFNTRNHAFETFGENFYSKNDFRWSSTTVTVNFNYRINQQKKRSTERRNSEGGEEGMMEF
jgi:outer membrane receptor protein involved in Fe transport